MNTFDLIEKTADINTDLLEEAATLKRKPQKGLKIAAILCCIIIALGVTAYATDMFGIRFPDTPLEGEMTIVANDGEASEYKTYRLDVLIPPIPGKEITGKVKDDLKYIENYLAEHHIMPDSRTVTGLTLEEANDYIGYRYLEPVWFPYENYYTVIHVDLATILIEATNEDLSVRTGNDPVAVRYLSPESVEGRLIIRSSAWLFTNDDDIPCFTDVGWTEGDEHYVITSRNGCECHIIDCGFETSGENPFWKMGGTTLKNGIVYSISIIYTENNRAEAERIVRAWAEHF